MGLARSNSVDDFGYLVGIYYADTNSQFLYYRRVWKLQLRDGLNQCPCGHFDDSDVGVCCQPRNSRRRRIHRRVFMPVISTRNAEFFFEPPRL